jgi:hypothetical protein
MKKIPSINSDLFTSIDAEKMRSVMGGLANPCITGTLAEITITPSGSSVDSPANPNDGIDGNDPDC